MATESKKSERFFWKWQPPAGGPGREPRYDCVDCSDLGSRRVWHSQATWHAAQGDYDRKRHAAFACARCTCRKGQEMSDKIPTYNELTMCLAEAMGYDENEAALMAFIAEQNAPREFNADDWNK